VASAAFTDRHRAAIVSPGTATSTIRAP